MLFRRDRIACTRGERHLQAMRLTGASKTRRMIAGCCTTPMYLAFDDKRPWVSAFRAGFGADAPPVEMRICTRFRGPQEKADDGLPCHPGYPPMLIICGCSYLVALSLIQLLVPRIVIAEPGADRAAMLAH